MREGDELRELSVLARDGGRPRCILRAVSSGLALVLSTFGFMGLGELCIFAMLLSGATIQDGGIGVRSDVLFVVYVSWNMKTNFPCRKFHQCIQTNKYLAGEHRHTRPGYTRTVDEQVVLRTRDSDSRSFIKHLRSLTLQLEPKPALPIQPGSQ